MFGKEEELQDEIANLKAENENLKLRLSVVIESLPTSMEIDRLKPYKIIDSDYWHGYESGMKEGAKWCRNRISSKLDVEPKFE